QCSADRLLRLYKEQVLAERSHHFLKGPLAVRPVFLHSNHRAAALVAVCSMALMVYGLVEADVRQAIAPQRTIPGLLPEGRAARPTPPTSSGPSPDGASNAPAPPKGSRTFPTPSPRRNRRSSTLSASRLSSPHRERP